MSNTEFTVHSVLSATLFPPVKKKKLKTLINKTSLPLYSGQRVVGRVVITDIIKVKHTDSIRLLVNVTITSPEVTKLNLLVFKHIQKTDEMFFMILPDFINYLHRVASAMRNFPVNSQLPLPEGRGFH